MEKKMTKREFDEMVMDIVRKLNMKTAELTEYEKGVLTKLAYGATYEDFDEVEK